MQGIAEQFFELFQGSEIAHGSFVVGQSNGQVKQQGTYSVVRLPTTVEHWEDHLSGGTGLGIIPIRTDNTCYWGAIDIDDYTVDLPKLAGELATKQIPVVVGRTKSGGAHLWIFCDDPVPAADMRRKLTELAAILGYAKSEIFPKQEQLLLDRGDVGNCLNMPYQAGDRTVRYAFDASGNSLDMAEFIAMCKERQLSLEQFYALEIADLFGGYEPAEVLEQGPPCLQHLCARGFTEGSRNNALFNLGVYARLFDEQNWETLVHKYNIEYLTPPLGHNEVGTVIKQLKKKEYFYRCEDQPINAHCDKVLCRERKYGVGPTGVTSDLSSLTKIDGDPPIWLLNVDGQRLELTTSGLTVQTQFQKECVAQINRFPVTVNQRAWQTKIQTLLDNVTVVEVPPDATLEGEFEDLLFSFCCERARGTDREDILQGISVWVEDRVFFQVKDVRKHLQANDFTSYGSNKITLRLQDMTAHKTFWRVRNKGVHVWSLPQSMFEGEEQPLALPPLAAEKDVL